MRILLIDINEPLVEAWKKEFSGCADVEVKLGSIFDNPCDAIVSPANSFGFMGGGLDGIISKNLGWHIQKKVQERIKDEFDGELLVGQSLIVHTGSDKFPFLISAPTMRVSMSLAGKYKMSPNIYLATKAIFLAIKKNSHHSIQSVAIPGLGTGVGNVPPRECAEKMRMAYEDFYFNKYVFPETFSDAHDMHANQTNITVLNGEETL